MTRHERNWMIVGAGVAAFVQMVAYYLTGGWGIGVLAIAGLVAAGWALLDDPDTTHKR